MASDAGGRTPRTKRRWRDYRTASGQRPVRDFLLSLSDVDHARVLAAMKDVQVHGRRAARHLRGDIWEVRAPSDAQTYRVLFATEGKHNHVLLSLEAFSKKTRQTPQDRIELAEQRLADWRKRGEDSSGS